MFDTIANVMNDIKNDIKCTYNEVFPNGVVAGIGEPLARVAVGVNFEVGYACDTVKKKISGVKKNSKKETPADDVEVESEA